jgi:hypothetical protein
VPDPTNFNALAIRHRLGKTTWKPPKPHGPDGWSFVNRNEVTSVIVSCAPHDDAEWVHASIAHAERMPTYDDLKLLHRAVFGGGWAYQVFAPPSDHVNIHEHALHLWGRLDGLPALPDVTFGMGSV